MPTAPRSASRRPLATASARTRSNAPASASTRSNAAAPARTRSYATRSAATRSYATPSAATGSYATPSTATPSPATASPATAATEADPFPFHRDGWWSKALVMFFVVVPLLGFAFAVWSFWGVGVGWFEILLLAGWWTFTGLGVSVGFHRMLTHRAIELRAPARFVALVAGTMAMQGPAADWAATHIRHHAKADREGDPHSPLEGFWHAHFGWLLRDRFVRKGLAHDKLMADPITRFVSKTWVAWATLGMVIPGVIAWGVLGGWALSVGGLLAFLTGILWGGVVRVFLGHHITWSVNSLGHMFGTRPFAIQDRATNNFVVALLGWGEGWHNNHHAFPRAAFMGMRWYQVDFGKYTIRFLQALGQVRRLHMPSRQERHQKRATRPAPTA